MNCVDCQNQIFEGDLSREAAVHLAGCEECRSLDREMRLNMAALAGLREEVIPVRAVKPRLWPWAAALAAAAAIIAAITLPTTTPAPVPVEPVAQIEPPAAAPAMPEVVVAATPPVRHVRRPAPPKRQPETPQEPLLVKFFTDDPDVVIYWLIDPPKGEIGL